MLRHCFELTTSSILFYKKLLTFSLQYCILCISFRILLNKMSVPEHNLFRKEVVTMAKYVCTVCGYVYDPAEGDPDNGIAPNTSFEDLPEDWVCPLCGVDKENFSLED